MHKIFKSNPNLKKAYITADDTAFYQEGDAKTHAKTLSDKTVETVFNEKELQVVNEENLSDEDKEMQAFEAAEKTAALKKLADFNPETTLYNDALKLFKALGLTSEDTKKDTIYPLLVAAKTAAIEGVNTEE